MTPFTIPNVPTDNLYKFYALSGIIIVVFSVSIRIYSNASIEEQLVTLDYDIALIKFERDNLLKDSNDWSEKAKIVDKMLEKHKPIDTLFYIKESTFDNQIYEMQNNPGYRDYLAFVFKYYDHILPEAEKLEQLKKYNESLKLNGREIDKKGIEIDYKLKKLKLKIDDQKIINYTTIFFIGLGLFLSIYGFNLWKKKVQNPIDKKLALDLSQLENKAK